jgi:transcriptional regulator with XRE-family HTH domain
VDIDSGPFLLTANVPPARVGARLAELRGRLGLSRRELASRLGVNRWWVRRWESGTHRLPDPVVRRLLGELGLSLEELIPRRVPLRWDATSRELVLGAGRVAVDPASGNDVVLRAYVDLVACTRATPPAGAWELRTDDLAVLVDLLDLDAADLDAQLAEVFALDDEGARALGGRMRRHRVVAASAVAAGVIAVGPGADARTLPATAVVATPGAATVVHVTAWQAPRHGDAVVVEAPADVALATVLSFTPPVEASPASPSTVDVPSPDSASPPAPRASEPPAGARSAPVEIADAVTVERPAVEIADAVTVERPAVEIADAVTVERPAVEIADALTIERAADVEPR